MGLEIKYGTGHLDWEAVCELIRRAPLGSRDPQRLRLAAQNSHTVCSAFDAERLVGFGRALSDGHYQAVICDVVVLPEYQGKGVGRAIMNALLEKLPKGATMLLYAAPGKQAFYTRFGFGNLKTGMGLFADPARSRANGYLE
jgi:aralkylamine N-acetyltransferase